jgi:hypothetical protein
VKALLLAYSLPAAGRIGKRRRGRIKMALRSGEAALLELLKRECVRRARANHPVVVTCKTN